MRVKPCAMPPNTKAQAQPTRDVNRDSGTDSANGGWLRRLVRPHGHTFRLNLYSSKIPKTRKHPPTKTSPGLELELALVNPKNKKPIPKMMAMMTSPSRVLRILSRVLAVAARLVLNVAAISKMRVSHSLLHTKPSGIGIAHSGHTPLPHALQVPMASLS